MFVYVYIYPYATRWATKVSFPPNCRLEFGHDCTTYVHEVNCVMQVDIFDERVVLQTRVKPNVPS